MIATVVTYGGEDTGHRMNDKPIRTVRHWQLYVNDRFVADTSIPADADLFQAIADACNAVPDPEIAHMRAVVRGHDLP